MYSYIFSIFLISLGINFHCSLGQTETTEGPELANETYHVKLSKQQNKILEKYQKLVIPSKGLLMTVTQAMIDHVEEVNELEQTISAHGFIQLQWKDPRLEWSGTDTMTEFYLPNWIIWYPKLYLLNSAAGANWAQRISWWARTRLQNDGQVTMKPRYSLKATCVFDYTNFPYDEQVCPLAIGSWDYSTADIDFIISASVRKPRTATIWGTKPKTAHVSNWEIKDIWHNITYLTHKEDNGTWKAMIVDEKPRKSRYGGSWPRYNIYFRLRRHAPYFGVTLVLPAVITSLFTISVFWTVKLDYGIYVCLVNILIQGMCSRDLLAELPPNIGGTPRIVIFYGVNLCLTALAIILILLMKGISSWTRPVPSFIQLFNEKFRDVRVLPPMKAVIPSSRFSQSVSTTDEPAENQEVIDKDQDPSTSLPYSVESDDWILFGNILRLILCFLYSAIYGIGMFLWLH